jgi:hypothetical protein
MPNRRRFPIALVIAALLAACASTGSGSSGGNRNVLTYDDLITTGETDLFTAIQELRPLWLRPRGPTSITSGTSVSIFVDGIPRGDVNELRSLTVIGVIDVTHLRAADAAFRFGTEAGTGGTIEVRYSRRQRDSTTPISSVAPTV